MNSFDFFFRKFFIGDDRRCSDADSVNEFPLKTKRRASFFGFANASHRDGHASHFAQRDAAKMSTTSFAAGAAVRSRFADIFFL
jgi:hypothetical protein